MTCVKYNDFSAYVLSNKYIKEKYKILRIVKVDSNKVSFIVIDKETNNKYFLKVKMYEHNSYDIDVYTKLKNNPHENIENICDVIKYEKIYVIMTEFLEGGNLKQCDINNINNIAEQIMSGIKHIHGLNIIHGDIKPENIMIVNNVVKIVDFDLARITDDKYILSNNIYGTENYMAPESFDIGLYSTKTDMWGFGILMYKLITNKFPYKNKLDRSYHFFVKNNFKNLDLTELDKYKNKYGNNIICMIKRLLEFNDSKRMFE